MWNKKPEPIIIGDYFEFSKKVYFRILRLNFITITTDDIRKNWYIAPAVANWWGSAFRSAVKDLGYENLYISNISLTKERRHGTNAIWQKPSKIG